MLVTAAAVALSPVLAAQAVAVRLKTPQLSAAPGPAVGHAGAGSPLRLILLGESTVAGVGAGTHARGLAGGLGAELAVCTGRSVAWRAVGEPGLDAAAACRRLLPLAAGHHADLVVIALGVNDVLAMHSARRWRTDLLRLIVQLRRSLREVRVVLAGVPPMDAFPALPQPLRTVLGMRSRELDAAGAALAERLPGTWHVPVAGAVLDPDSFAADGFHPSEGGYRQWAAQLAGEMCAAGAVTPAPRPAQAAE